jgi:uncharacterized CHY-type Zn-finger protein
MAREGNRLIESEERWQQTGKNVCRFCPHEITYSEYKDLDGACPECDEIRQASSEFSQ